KNSSGDKNRSSDKNSSGDKNRSSDKNSNLLYVPKKKNTLDERNEYNEIDRYVIDKKENSNNNNNAISQRVRCINNYYYSSKNEHVKMISNTYKNIHIIINVTQIGVSIISNILKEEVLFIELSKLCILFYMKNEQEIIDVKITDVQIDCQLESCEKGVLLANRGITKGSNTMGSSNVTTINNNVGVTSSISSGVGTTAGGNNNGSIVSTNNMNGDKNYFYYHGKNSHEHSFKNKNSRAYDKNNEQEEYNHKFNTSYVYKKFDINENSGNNNNMNVSKRTEKNMNSNDEKMFLSVYVEKSYITHNDVIFKKIQISLDDVEVEMDADTLNGINLLIAEYMERINTIHKNNVLYEEIENWANLPIYINYKTPEIPLALNIQYMQIDKLTLNVWCSFLLDKMHMLSDILRIGLRILMVSGKLELLGAPVTLNQEIFNNIRVSMKSFYALLKDKYSHSILACLGLIVGYSSLINIPRIPIELGKNTIGLAVYAVDNVSVGIGSFLSNLTFDSEYINRRQKERNFKTNTNMKEGLISAVKNIGEGVLSLSNIVTKPIEGAQKEGFGGFFKGIGKGVAGSLVKPLDKVGQAVSDVTRGIKAEVSKPFGSYKYKTKRHRKPRMLWGEYGKIKEYNLNEATLRECLGLKFSKNIMKCLTIHKQENYPPSHYALLLYPKVIIYANLYVNKKNNENIANEKKTDIVMWSIKIEDITEIRASSHGLIIKTLGGSNNNLMYKIPCNNAFLINDMYRELHNSKNSIKSTVILGHSDMSLHNYI
ncbi:conserved protein, unknown function, partial [Hepatocystis sp. ex Piliocolobus tephrosceles]